MKIESDTIVSIVMPVYNAGTMLERSIGSILNQSYKNWELLAVDDRSTDSSLMILRKMSLKDPRIRVIAMEENKGAGHARNRAIHVAKGRYLSFLDADDEWKNSKLAKQISFMQSGSYAFSCTAYERANDTSNSRKKIFVPVRSTYEQLLKNNTVGTSTVMLDRTKFSEFQMSTMRKRQDYDLWLRLLLETDAVYGMNELLTVYHIGHSSLSSNKLLAAQAQWSFYRNELNFDIMRSAYYFAHYAVNASRRNF